MAFTRTVTLYGAELSSFLAAGGQTVDPNAPVATPDSFNALNFPVAVSSTSTPLAVRPAAVTTTPVAIPSNRVVTLSGGPSSSSRAALVVVSTASLAPPVVRSASSSSTTRAPTTTAAVRSTTASSSRRPSASASSAASLLNGKKQSSGLSGGAIAGIVIGVLALLALLAAALLLIRKRKKDKRHRAAAMNEKRNPRQAEKGAYRLDETEVPGGGFDFGPLVPIAGGAGFGAAAAAPFGRNSPQRSASPALTLDRAAVLGIQRPLTPSAVPPPGHPGSARTSPPFGAQQQGFMPPQPQAPYPRNASPMGQMRMASGAAMMPVGSIPQQQQRGFAPQGQQQMQQVQQMPRKPVEAANPFADGVHNSTSMSSMTAPMEERSMMPAAAAAAGLGAGVVAAGAAVAHHSDNDAKRMSASSFAAGDDSLEESVPAVAERAESPSEPFKKHDSGELPARSNSVIKPVEATNDVDVAPALAHAPVAAAPAENESLAPTENGPVRTKSVAAATDNWAARKEHLKKTLASSQHSTTPKASPAQQQDPFGDHHATPPAIKTSPALQDTPVLSPMDFSFATQLGEDATDAPGHA
ncbi:hypothetical protein BCR37DRAFT_388651 [Protomyces lactucae-debilis]|uniref:Uncharacterized protein n=1 Tax=Protomyces lactucae-debilis TaxID=2754530 RepID=A0A1Y2F5B1_PROLT|nr:uncharacterized protein BCR37DRAFT_388651 [Protomyces lactucae-debilis]ORY79051.1 hypothetical protein BCR37DRAFT_388651 [Protomyces lactucae-debilis]